MQKKMKVTPDIFLIRQDKITELFRLHCVENSTIYSIRRMYYNEHCIVFNDRHIPMKINKAVLLSYWIL